MTKHTGLTRFPSTNYKTTKHCVAYLDMLGAKRKICEDTDSKFLNYLNMIFGDAIKEADWLSADIKEKIFVKIFSDNILFAIETEDELTREKNITTILNLVANICNEAFDFGYLLRGAIVENEFFHNNIIVYGKALVEAVYLEEEIAKNPRILVQKEIVDLLPQYHLTNKDGNSFLNIFEYSTGFDHITYKLQILKMLENNKDSDDIKEKIFWLIDYFNSWFKSPYARVLEKPQITKEEIDKALMA